MRTLKFYGCSDDLFEIEGTKAGEPDEIGCFEKPAAVNVVYGEAGVRVWAVYARGETGTWMIGIEPLDEDIPVPDWPIRMGLSDGGYSTEIAMDVPDGATVSQVFPAPESVNRRK